VIVKVLVLLLSVIEMFFIGNIVVLIFSFDNVFILFLIVIDKVIFDIDVLVWLNYI